MDISLDQAIRMNKGGKGGGKFASGKGASRAARRPAVVTCTSRDDAAATTPRELPPPPPLDAARTPRQ